MEQWSTSFDRARPTGAYTSTSTRIAIFKSLTIDIEQYYKERNLLNEQYLKSLRKLSSKLQNGSMTTQIDILGIDKRELDQGLGGWKDVIRTLEREIDQLAGNHEVYGKKISETVEKSLRESLATPTWSRWNQQDLQLGSLIREFESSKDKLAKAQSKVQSKSSKSTSSKLLTAQSQLSSLNSTIATILPNYLNASQELEMEHTISLKESLTRYGTITADLGREKMESGEKFVSITLGIDEREEMIDWVKRESKRSGAPGNAPQLESTNLGRGEFGETGNTLMEEPSEMESLSIPPPVPMRQNSTSSVSNVSAPRSQPPPVGSLLLPTNSLPPSIRSNSITTIPPSTQSSNNNTNASNSSGFKLTSFLGNRDRSGSNSNSKYGNLDAPTYSLDDSASIQSRIDQEEDNDQFSTTSTPMKSSQSLKSEKRKSVMPSFSGATGLFRRPSKMISNPPPPPPPMRTLSNAGREVNERKPSYSSGMEESNNVSGSVDEDGYSVPPKGYDKQPWENSPGGLMDDEEEEDNFDGGVTPKLGSVSIIPSNIINTESEVDKLAALERVKNTLLLSSNGSGSSSSLGMGTIGSMTRKTTTSRGRRDQSRNNSYNPTGNVDEIPLAKIIEQARFRESSNDTVSTAVITPSTSTFIEPATPTTPSVFASSMGAGRAGSINSTTSNVNARNVADPFVGSEFEGLKASVLETVNVLIKGGEISRVMITGEISLNLKTGESRKSGRIRILNYKNFEKKSPNFNFLTAVDGVEGEFDLSPVMLSRGFSTVVVFRYQLKVDKSEEMNYVPLQVRTQWKTDASAKQSSLIIYYSITSKSNLSNKESSPFGEEDQQHSLLSDVSFHVPISTPISTFQSKPTATYSSEKNRLSFAIEPISFSNLIESKLLARMNTEGENLISPQPISVRWKLIGTFSGSCIEMMGTDDSESIQLVEQIQSAVSGKYLVA